ncbi:MAG: KOW domain-containing RNA-binding protein [Clostridia bacterium]|nr:KOW domain-containing RNA-binding protein [Clostridia bacterium]
MREEIAVGDVVISKAGRDAKRLFVVTEVVDAEYVLLCDGDLRKLDKPKRKKIKHLKRTGIEPMEAVVSGERILDSDIRKYLKEQGLTEKNR